MLSKLLSVLYDKFRVDFYMRVFNRIGNEDTTLTTVEALSMECIRVLGRPTVQEYANMMGISAPNAAYKVNSLVEKGYIRKVQSKEDHREFFLEPTPKFTEYYKNESSYLDALTKRCEKRFSADELNHFSSMLSVIETELVPELNAKRYRSPNRKDH